MPAPYSWRTGIHVQEFHDNDAITRVAIIIWTKFDERACTSFMVLEYI
jgi:hypothetical protein